MMNFFMASGVTNRIATSCCWLSAAKRAFNFCWRRPHPRWSLKQPDELGSPIASAALADF
jgi:hypothetical protein